MLNINFKNDSFLYLPLLYTKKDKIKEEYHFSDGAAFDKEVEAYNTSLENMKIK